jgi:hypothetical protein
MATTISGSGGITTSQSGLDSTDYLKFTDNTQLDIFINNSNEFRFKSDGEFHADGDIVAFSTTVASDENLKKNIATVTKALETVEAIRGVTYDWKRDGKSSAGVIAQEVQSVLPKLVKTNEVLDGTEGFLTVNYHALIAYLIESIKELSARVKVLEAK